MYLLCKAYDWRLYLAIGSENIIIRPFPCATHPPFRNNVLMHLLIVYLLDCLLVNMFARCCRMLGVDNQGTERIRYICSLILTLSLTIVKLFIIYSYVYHSVTLFVCVDVFFCRNTTMHMSASKSTSKAIDAEFDFANIGDCATFSGSKWID